MDKGQGRGEKIFVVDDENAIVNAICQYLDLEGFIAVKCHTAHECLEKLKQETPDAIISDIMMPGLTGLQLLEFIKKDKSLESIPVILVTAKGSDRDQLDGWQKGAAQYITKPFRMNEIVNALRLALDEKRRQAKQKIYEIE